ncbi:glycosyltransferase family 2 protein [Alloiococcus sp. CFN-8]|uniref:glycosyltransferase family 2 protein n=1 Tax=Alloiococcus sp. CFN-8 TaxID=3416081 RepID=UPI003CF41093
MKKLIIIPAYNEESNIKDVVNYIIRTVPDYDYIIINDGSTDKTEEICKNEGFNYISLPVNLGIGGAVQTGYRYALENQYDIAVQIDGDGQHDCRDLDRLLDKLKKNRYNMVIGSRFISREGFQSSFTRRLGISYFSSLIKAITKVRITDPTSGLRMCDKRVIEVFAKEYPTDYPEPESIVTIIRKGFSVGEVEANMKERQGGVSSINAMKAVYYMIKVTLAILISYAANKNIIGGLQANDA